MSNGFIEVKLFDSEHNCTYKKRAELKNKKKVKELFAELEYKGLDIKTYDISFF